MNIPKTIFIIPYRDRQEQKVRFEKTMRDYLDELNKEEDTNIGPYLFVYAHQADTRPFNRGAMKNIGFLTMKKMFMNNYKDITFVFHDVDTFPGKIGIIPYKTQPGIVSHYYGFKFALGGIFAIKGGDFEKSEGFPNFWGWGLEDNAIYNRCLEVGLNVDRSIFYDISDSTIERPFDGNTRLVSKRDVVVYKHETPDCFKDITNLDYDLVEDRFNENKTKTQTIFMANIKGFDCVMDPDEQDYYEYDVILNKGKMRVPSGYSRRSWSLNNLFMSKNTKMKSPTPSPIPIPIPTVIINNSNYTNNKTHHNSSKIMGMENIMRISNPRRMF
jgi:hypothetical protein